MPRLETCTGKENFPVGASSLHMFAFVDAYTQQGIYACTKAQKISSRSMLAGQGLTADCGRWSRSTYEVDEGLIVKIVMSLTNKEWGREARKAAIFIKCRDNAPYNIIRMNTTQWADRSALQQVVTEGRFDIMTLEQVARAQIKLPPYLQENMNVRSRAGWITIDELEPSRGVVQKHVEQAVIVEGEKVIINVKRRTRKFGIGN